MKLKSTWYDGLDEDQKKELRADFISASVVRKRLIQMIEDKIETKRKFLRSDDNYQSPNWAGLMADGVGYERALTEIISLLTTSEK